ncbi:MAG: hypothetical protein IKN26_08760 [Eubacterium sp.]|nr:hypothetical protein [Eubacterium sp.]
MNDSRAEYGDIIDMPHHQSDKRAHMSLHDRAAQFAPFAALRGYDDEITETARTTEARIELSAEKTEELNEKLKLIASDINQTPEVLITYFKPDNKKSGGAYITETGFVRRIDEIEKIIIFTDDRKININDIYEIKINKS